MNLDHDFFQVSKLSEDKKKVFTKNGTHFFPRIQVKTKKKRSSPEKEHFFPPNSSGDLRSNAHWSQIIGGDADEDHTQIIGGGYSQIIGGIYPPFPPGFGTPAYTSTNKLCH